MEWFIFCAVAAVVAWRVLGWTRLQAVAPQLLVGWTIGLIVVVVLTLIGVVRLDFSPPQGSPADFKGVPLVVGSVVLVLFAARAWGLSLGRSLRMELEQRGDPLLEIEVDLDRLTFRPSSPAGVHAFGWARIAAATSWLAGAHWLLVLTIPGPHPSPAWLAVWLLWPLRLAWTHAAQTWGRRSVRQLDLSHRELRLGDRGQPLTEVLSASVAVADWPLETRTLVLRTVHGTQRLAMDGASLGALEHVAQQIRDTDRSAVEPVPAAPPALQQLRRTTGVSDAG